LASECLMSGVVSFEGVDLDHMIRCDCSRFCGPTMVPSAHPSDLCLQRCSFVALPQKNLFFSDTTRKLHFPCTVPYYTVKFHFVRTTYVLHTLLYHAGNRQNSFLAVYVLKYTTSYVHKYTVNVYDTIYCTQSILNIYIFVYIYSLCTKHRRLVTNRSSAGGHNFVSTLQYLRTVRLRWLPTSPWR
jgi:hypothetical protein